MAERPRDWSPDWRDADDRQAVGVPHPPGADEPSPYLPIGAFQGPEYHRNAFARGTDHEVAVLRDLLSLEAGERVIDIGCADGRHLRALAAFGVRGVGVDVVHAPMGNAPAVPGVGFVRADARRPGLRAATADAVLCLCQGAVGTSPAVDGQVLGTIAALLRPGGRVAITFFHALFAVRHLTPGDAFDPVHLVHHHTAEVTGPDRQVGRFPLWTSAYTVPGAIAALERVGLEAVSVRGVEPGRYGDDRVGLDDPELLVVARRPTGP